MLNEWVEIVDQQAFHSRLAEEENRQLRDDMLGAKPSPQRSNFSFKRAVAQEVATPASPLKRYIVLSVDRRVAGLIEVDRRHENDKFLFVTRVSIEKVFDDSCCGNVLAEALFQYASGEKLTVRSDAFNPAGQKRFGHIFARLNIKFSQTPLRN